MSFEDLPVIPRPEKWRNLDGVVLLDKPVGLTSNQALQWMRRLFAASKGGHTGTLDPFAEHAGNPDFDGIVGSTAQGLPPLPLPKGMDDKAVIAAIDPAKDVDGFHVVNAGKLAVGEEALVPCTPMGCIMMLKDRLGDLSGQQVFIAQSGQRGRQCAPTQRAA